ncbi:phosphatidylserine decarboxylase-domain-containing protein [Aspergillus venezuelensis]
MDFIKDKLPFGRGSGDSTGSIINDLKTTIEINPDLLGLSAQMFAQTTATGQKDLVSLFKSLASATRAPPSIPKNGPNNGLTCPITDILNEYTSTPAGNKLFTNESVHSSVEDLLKEWTVYLTSPESAQHIPDTNSSELQDVDFGSDTWNQRNSYSSWDHFFTRQFPKGARLIAEPDNDRVVTAPCEGKMDNFETDITSDTVLTIKGRKYTLAELLGDDGSEEPFVGGSIYQGSTPGYGYHWFHAPISGTITKCVKIPGRIGFLGRQGSDGTGIEPTRALVTIQGGLGSKVDRLICVFSGLMPQNAVEIAVEQGQEVTKGQELGMFHFGGSTYALVVRKSVHIDLDQVGSGLVPVRSALVTV